MKLNKEHERLITLYFYGELDEAQQAEAEALLKVDPACQQVLEQLQGLEQVVPHQPSIEPTNDVMYAMRQAVSQQIRRSVQPSVAERAAAWWQPRILLPQLAFSLVLIAVGFFLGQNDLPRDERLAVLESEPMQQLILANQPVEDTNGSIDPFFAGVQDIAFDPETGMVEVRYNTVNEVSWRGQPDDAVVQQLLQQALLDDENPAGRLRAVNTLQAVAAQQVKPDSMLVDALLVMLRDEENQGMRLQALEALGSLYERATLDPTAKRMMIKVMLNDENPALRMEAMRVLTQNARENQNLAGYLRAAQADTNAFIRNEAGRMLALMEQGQPLATPLEATDTPNTGRTP